MDPTPLISESRAVRCGCADALSDVLDAVRLRSHVASLNEFTAPWGVRVPGSAEEPWAESPSAWTAPLEIPNAGFYAIVDGSCWLEVNGQPPLHLGAGDVVVILDEHGHQICDDLYSLVCPIGELNPQQKMRQGSAMRYGGGGPMTRFIGGAFFFEDREYNRLFSALPPFIHLPAVESATGSWLAQTMRFVTRETSTFHPGTQSLINHLSHVLLVQAIRTYLSKLPPGRGNWLGALLDPDIGQAITLIHASPQDHWTVASLADTVAMSRSAFAARFTALVGQPPLQYLSHLRLVRATALLGNGRAAIKQIANQVGYESEASFSKLFKRQYGVSPGIYRREICVHRRRSEPATDDAAPSDHSAVTTAVHSQYPSGAACRANHQTFGRLNINPRRCDSKRIPPQSNYICMENRNPLNTKEVTHAMRIS
jgi:AraC-like DNA-binding protein